MTDAQPDLAIGEAATVAVTVATLWHSPERVRRVDEAATETPPDPRTWATGMTDDEQQDLNGRAESQLLLGERVVVHELGAGWARVTASEQSSSKNPGGYPGWIPVAQLRAPVDAAPTHVVHALTASLHDRPAGRITLRDVVLGTRVTVRDAMAPSSAMGSSGMAPSSGARSSSGIGSSSGIRSSSGIGLSSGDAGSGWSLVSVAGHEGWIRSDAIRPSGMGAAAGPSSAGQSTSGPGSSGQSSPDQGRPDQSSAGRDPLTIAERLLRVRYVWGGLTPFGIDCSGLVHLSHRLAGLGLPRDAYDQVAATIPVELGDELPGDLYFFARPGRLVHHVGFVAARPDPDGTRHMLHASGGESVIRERLTAARTATLTGARRVPA
jgi:gamma-D-glutamyl-L-lysine dipeptidyl-peptidase